MAETLGSLCDKLTIVRLKEWHTDKPAKLESLCLQRVLLEEELDTFVSQAIEGRIPTVRLKFDSNKVYVEETHALREISGTLGSVISKLAEANCALWHQQEKIYEFEKISAEEKDGTIKELALLNLERNRCIEMIDAFFCEKIANQAGPAATVPAI